MDGDRPRHPHIGLLDECGRGTRFDTHAAETEGRHLNSLEACTAAVEDSVEHPGVHDGPTMPGPSLHAELVPGPGR